MSTSPYSGAEIKRGAAHFLVGKFASALLNVIIIFWLVRLLTIEDYGAYVALVAGMEFALAITSLGLPWVAARYLPEFRLHASGIQLENFIWQIIGWISLFLIASSLLLFLVMPWLLAPIKFAQYTDVARLYLIVLFIGGLGRHLQDTALGPLLQQGRAQISIVTRNITFPLFLGVAAVQGEVHLNQLVLAELAASVLSTSVAVLGLIRHLRSRHDFPGRVGWNPPTWSEMWCVGRQMYVTELVALAYSRQVLIFMTQRFLGVETTALFGFLLNLYGQVARYLPANLLFGLIRPKLVASYVDKGCMAELTRNANLVGKLNLFVLVPLLIFAWLALYRNRSMKSSVS